MKNKTVLAGAALGLVGAVLLLLFVAQAGGGGQDGPTTPVYVVTETLEPGMSGDQITGRVEAAEVPERIAPEQRISDLAELGNKEVVRTVGAGEVLTAHQVAAPGPLAGGVVVPAGYEAVTVEAEPAPGVEGYVTPGARVNVYATLDQQGGAPAPAPGGGGAYTQLVLGHVAVLATSPADRSGQPQDGAGPSGQIVLMLQVRPEDAPVLIHAQRQGQLWFSLVNPDDPAPNADRVTSEQFDPSLRTREINEAAEQQAAAQAQQTEQGNQAQEETQQ